MSLLLFLLYIFLSLFLKGTHCAPSTSLFSPPPSLSRGNSDHLAKLSHIVGGSDAPRYIQRRHVFILSFFRGDKTPTPCSGTVLSKHLVLTAAHCVVTGHKQRPANAISLFFNRRFLPNSSFDSYATTLYVHREYVNLFRADIAILRVKHDVFRAFGARPVVLYNSEQLPFNSAYVAGFGRTTTNGPFATTLQQAWLRLLKEDECIQAETRFRRNVNESSHVCTAAPGFPNTGGRDACFGDSGGPLFLRRTGMSVVTQIAITSWGPEVCGAAGTVSWYTRVHRYIRDVNAVITGQVGADGRSNSGNWWVQS